MRRAARLLFALATLPVLVLMWSAAIGPDLVGRLAMAASEAVGAVEAELEESGQRLDEFHRELLVSNAVDDELVLVNTERIRVGDGGLDDEDRQQARTLVLAELYGTRGRIGSLLQGEGWDELNINSADNAWLTFPRYKERVEPVLFADDDELLAWLKTMARRGSDVGEYEFSAAHPRLSMQLADGSRMYAIWGGRGSGGLGPHPLVSIRRHRVMDFVLEELKLGSPVVEACMRAIVKAKLTVLVTGDTGAGKTATARALAHEAPFHHRILTLESTRELALENFPDRHGDVAVLETREANVEGQGAVTLGDLVQHTLRLHPDRLWMGEILGPGEVAAFMNVLAGGHRGSLATLHGFSAEGALFRLQSLCQQPPNNFTEGAANTLIASAVDFIIHLECDQIEEDRGRIIHFDRYVSEVVEVTGWDGQRIQVNPIFTPGPDGRAQPYHPLSTERHRRLAKVGYQHQSVSR